MAPPIRHRRCCSIGGCRRHCARGNGAAQRFPPRTDRSAVGPARPGGHHWPQRCGQVHAVAPPARAARTDVRRELAGLGCPDWRGRPGQGGARRHITVGGRLRCAGARLAHRRRADAAGQVRSRRGSRHPRSVVALAGERTRAALALLQANGVNLLVLDEPTNHLDLPAIEQLEEALESFDGTVLLVTHDRRMLETVRLTRRWHVEDGVVTEVAR